jgi:hypothetical protein
MKSERTDHTYDKTDDSHNEIVILQDKVYSLLEPRASYLSGGSENDVRHFIPSEYLDTLSWLVVTVAIPILTNTIGAIVASTIMHDKTSRAVIIIDNPRTNLGGPITKDKEYKDLELAVEQKEKLTALMLELFNAYPQIIKEGNLTEDSILSAKEEIYKVLSDNGLPSSVSQEDSEKIIQIILEHFQVKLK